jgi:MFS family permease
MKRVFHGWWMVAAGCAMQFVQSCLLLQSFGAYVAVLRDDRGWSKTELAGAAALHQVEAAILGPVLGWFIDRFGPQGVIRAGVLTFGAGFMLLSFIDSLLAFYGAFLVLALGASLCGFFPLNVALIHWFERKRARALSSMQFGLALGGLAVPAVAWSLGAYGWRATMSPYEILQPGGSVEYFNEEPGAVWLKRVTEVYPKCVWLCPEPEEIWGYRQSIQVIKELMGNRMYPITLEGLERAMKVLAK